MKDKIEWYKEVLEIEPCSRVFFPLARLLSENGRKSEAVSVLRRGLEKHPEFFEARLMLIDLVQQAGDTQQIVTEVSALGENLCTYPGFWEAWALHAEQANGNRSLVFALRFLAAHLKNKDLSLIDILERGVNSILAGDGSVRPQTAFAKEKEIAKGESSSADIPVSASAAALESLAREKDAHAVPEKREDPVNDEFGGASDEPLSVAFSLDSEESEEPVSLRTRTMAALLADQGDFQGALEIYNELLQSEENDERRSELEMCVRSVQARMKSSGSGQEPPVAVSEEPSESKHKLVKTLELLAQRLESRAVH